MLLAPGVDRDPSAGAAGAASFEGAADAAALSLASVIEDVRANFHFLPATLAGYAAGVAVIAAVHWGGVPRAVVTGFVGSFTLLCVLRLLVFARFRVATPQTLQQWKRWRSASTAGTLATAAMWGATGWFFYDQGGDPEQSTGLILIVYTYCVVSIPVLAARLPLYSAYVALCMLPLVARISLDHDAASRQLAAELLVIIAFTGVLANTYRQTLQGAIALKLQSDEMATRLRTEKLAADAARREAEIANRAKTQFFAAASHDLRQPLHAMGLFAEALRQRTHEPQVAQLVGSINESVDALEGLFSELLDITRLDSGAIEVQREDFVVGPLLQRVRLHFEPGAFEKGLRLRLRGAGHVADADPTLVERIVRNLVSNAIRYTNDGTVLVSCRRRGARLLLQVWDTGLGIRESEQKRIFDEFYQTPKSQRLSAEQRRGLGLGLAIVRRFADLMGAPLSLRSVPGRGSVFTLDLPVGRLGRRSAGARAGTVARQPVAPTLEGRCIVVVEDDPAVRAGLEVLLAGWGARVVAFDGAAACRAWLEGDGADDGRGGGEAAGVVPAPARAPSAPHLLIADFRLDDDASGLDLIDDCRRRFGTPIPAIVVTGSLLAAGHDTGGRADLHVLLKPVVPNKLRAMIAYKLGARTDG